MKGRLIWMCRVEIKISCLPTGGEESRPNLSACKICCLISGLFSRFVAPNNWLIRYTHPYMHEDRFGIPRARRIRISQHSIGIWRRKAAQRMQHKFLSPDHIEAAIASVKKSFSISMKVSIWISWEDNLRRIILLKSTNFGFDAKFAFAVIILLLRLPSFHWFTKFRFWKSAIFLSIFWPSWAW